MKILIVDDVAENIQVLASSLKKEGYEIAAAMNGKEGLDLAEKMQPDLILLDMMMPEMDGMETISHLKKSKSLKDIPVIFLTAKNETGDIVKGFEAGAVDYITKPFNATELLVRICTHLQLKQKTEELQKTSQANRELVHILCHDLVNPAGFIDSIFTMSKDDNSIIQEMLPDLITSSENVIAMINMVRMLVAMEDGKTVLQNTSVTLGEVFNNVNIILGEKFKTKNIQLEIDPSVSDITVKAEPVSLLNTVINNLLTNAVKFSAENSKISVSAKTENGTVNLVIRDYGIGIPDAMINDIFSLSKNTSRAGTSGERGTGYGMPLVKKFMKMYGGDINVRSWELGKSAEHGTEITLTFLQG